ncbi:flagellar hook-basal body protein [Helicobacter ailurogastricus]|uniref:Flagellar basal-body rod protein FlgG n=1 Tax=Helicobacter ailurogastricus TaxID=1578720 RepID=A0A0K2Y8N5_9HELI|nr:flagellar hook-basal body protein [Helicobacter ailurogastricus]BDQ28687.1 flagellar basal body protein [Helicobacter ailurogastricus]CRI32214.1 Flagellar basal-body rod protein FlgG [Helicobacter ailurogastricus]
MTNGYYAATGGMVTEFNRLDQISNNLANLNTAGFKRDDVVVGDFLRLYQNYRDKLPLPDQTKQAAKYLNRNLDRVPIIVERYTDYSLGPMQKTDNELDFALSDPNAYFVVQTPQGIAFTRDGSFTIDAQGFLSTKEGYHVLSRGGIENGAGIQMLPGASVSVSPNGDMFFRQGGEEVPGGALAVVGFQSQKLLKKIGDNLYTYPQDKMDERTELNAPIVHQHFLEKSNVNAVIEMTRLIEANRLVDMYSKVLRTHMDDMHAEAISKLAARA